MAACGLAWMVHANVVMFSRNAVKELLMLQLVLALTLGATPIVEVGLAGQVIQSDTDPTRYYVGADGRRYVFPLYQSPAGNYDVFATWYADESHVLTVSRTQLETLAIGGNVTLRQASVLTGIATDARVYVIAAGGVLREIAPEHAERLFGTDWRTHVRYTPDAYFVNYALGSPYVELAHPEGLLFRYAGSSDVFLMDGGSARPIDAANMAVNGFRPEYVFVIPDELHYRQSATIDRREERLTIPAGPIQMFTRGETDNVVPSNLSDAIAGLNYLFLGGVAPACFDAADVDDNGTLNLTDPVALLNFLFLGGAAPAFPGISLIGDNLNFDPTPDDLLCRCYRCDVPQLEVQASPLPEGFVLAGASDATIGRFTFRLRSGPKVTALKLRLELTLSRRGASTASLDYVSNVRLVDLAGTVIAGPVDPRLGSETVEDSNGFAIFTDPFTVGADPLTVNVLATISAATPAGDYLTAAISPSLDITTALPALLGPNSWIASTRLEIATSGHLEFRFAQSSASASLVPGLVNDVRIGDLTVRATNENIRLERLDLAGIRTNPEVGGGAWGQMRKLKLYYFADLVAETIPVSDGGLNDVEERLAILQLNPPVVIPTGSSGVLRLTVDTERVSRYGENPGPGYAGQGFLLRIAKPTDVHATGLQSGARVTIDASQAVLPPVTVCVTTPTVTLNEELPAIERLENARLQNAAALPIYRYRVAADQAADLALYQNGLRLTLAGLGNVKLENLQLVDASSRIRASGKLAMERTDGALRVQTYRLVFDDGAANPQPLVVPAGSAVTLTGRADISGVEQGSVMIIQFLGDDGFPAVYPASAAGAADRVCFPPCPGSGHFVWGDLSYSGPLGISDPRILLDPQWYNGHQVRTPAGKLPTASHPLTFSNE